MVEGTNGFYDWWGVACKGDDELKALKVQNLLGKHNLQFYTKSHACIDKWQTSKALKDLPLARFTGSDLLQIFHLRQFATCQRNGLSVCFNTRKIGDLREQKSLLALCSKFFSSTRFPR
jgi:hypothetical protein